ncbi:MULTISPECIES: HWE histidine kinase domain-containing protein [Rhodomicrobium]|uniref:sensor histidine kinase n=1 Tax=Rhodomicrobium TaxID=1068 RepID=UPI001482B1D5|nr:MULTISPECIES: HWE histidine kinase domain-containing protein [Rhodomicrobium]
MQAHDRAMAGDDAFRELADFAPVLIWRAGPDKLCNWFNKPWLDFVGRSLQQELGLGWAEGVHPDDLERCLATYDAAFDARKAFSMEYRLRRHDGEFRWLLDNGSPFYRNGEFAGFFGSCVDVTEHKRAEAHQRLMIDELNHRVKNALSIVQSLAQQSFGGPASTTAEAASAFESRLHAFSNAHDLLADDSWQAASLDKVLGKVLAPWCGNAGRYALSGPPVSLPPRTAVTFAIAMHELCMNAVKFGALSTEAGRVHVNWSTRSDPAPRFELEWREEGGPPVAPPSHRGFGLRMLERALAAELQGDIAVQFQPAGLVCTIRAPLPEAASAMASS